MSKKQTKAEPNNDHVLEEAPMKAEKSGTVRTFTYVGAGETPPRKIMFMGVLEFVRGKPVDISVNAENKVILGKLAGNPSFVEGDVDEDKMQEILHEQDEDAARNADAQRLADRKLNAAYAKKHKTE